MCSNLNQLVCIYIYSHPIFLKSCLTLQSKLHSIYCIGWHNMFWFTSKNLSQELPRSLYVHQKDPTGWQVCSNTSRSWVLLLERNLWWLRVLVQGTTGVPRTVYQWYLLCSTLGFLGIITHKYPLYRAYIGISHRGTVVGVHPTIPSMVHVSGQIITTKLPPGKVTLNGGEK